MSPVACSSTLPDTNGPLLDHSEQFHSTPETQTDEAYTHPEDLEHFAHHEQIERIEAEREAKYQGISVDEVLAQHEPHDHPEPPQEHSEGSADPQFVAQNPHDDQLQPPPDAVEEPPAGGAPKKVNRVTPPEKQDPAIKYASAKADAEGHGEWGAGSAGYKPPKTPSEKMRCVSPTPSRLGSDRIDVFRAPRRVHVRVAGRPGRTSRTRCVLSLLCHNLQIWTLIPERTNAVQVPPDVGRLLVGATVGLGRPRGVLVISEPCMYLSFVLRSHLCFLRRASCLQRSVDRE